MDLHAGDGRAVIWGLATEDLNVNLVAWPEGDGVASHVNAELDVLIVVIEGTLRIVIDGVTQTVGEAHALIVPKGATRSLHATGAAVRYLTAHRRRPPLALS